MKLFYSLFLSVITVFSFAQSVTHGPIVGGVTENSCRVFVRTDIAINVIVEASTTSSFASIAASNGALTDVAKDNVATIELNGLSADTKYYVRITISGIPTGDVAKFETFLTPSASTHQIFVTGSCIDDLTSADSSLFVQAKNEKAKAFIEMGNWGYPDANAWLDIYFTNPPNSWAKIYSNVQSLYKQRYVSPVHQSFVKSLAVDYVYDDHDYMNEKTGSINALGYIINIFSGSLGSPENWNMPPQARLNSIQGYQDWFPGYNLQNSAEGIYHSFRSGNAEFFVLDTRSMRGPDLVSVVKINNVWVYQPVPGSSLLGVDQMNWFKNGLQNSTATWKFIVSSVPFNVGARFALDSLIKIGNGTEPYWNPVIQNVNLPKTGFSATNHFIDWWSGFKAEQDSLLGFIFSNNIKNVFVLSGNSGTVGLDDGTNSGLPELNSGNLKIANTEDGLTFQKFMKFNIWNRGGSGLCRDTNFNATYGRLEVFNNDSIRLSAVDANGEEVVSANFYVNAPYRYNPAYTPNRFPKAVDDLASVANTDTVTVTVVANDTDSDNEPLFVSINSNPAHGTASVSNNDVTYIPNQAFVGVDTFYYQLCDSYSGSCPNCDTALVTINVTPNTSIVNLQNEVQLKVFPNPANNFLFVEAVNSAYVFEFEMSNSVGEKIAERNFSNKTAIDISSYPAGSYVYKIRNKNNELLQFGKVNVIR